ncbi:MAG: N-acetylneuraminate synthase family protein, partial [Proteobacteria bacterium]|nr:N-acetylneuraminate synthase family protein [Pseudomonadota bacterium]
ASTSSPYDFEAVDMLEPFVPAYKIGSGDITWPEMLRKISAKGKPVLLATGASDINEVRDAVNIIKCINPNLVLMQCNTNYTGSLENFRYINLNVLKTFKDKFPDVVLGLSDHTLGYVTVLGAVALGGRVIEKHFTDDMSREGPDHVFSMIPEAWAEMVLRTRELEDALGGKEKRVEDNEQETVILQRRCLRAKQNLKIGTILTRHLIDVLRPAPRDAISPYDVDRMIGMRLMVDLPEGEYFKWSYLETVN